MAQFKGKPKIIKRFTVKQDGKDVEMVTVQGEAVLNELADKWKAKNQKVGK